MKTTSPSKQQTCLNSFIIQNMDATTFRGQNDKKTIGLSHFQEDSNALKYKLFGYCMNEL
jgi:hypothetical protein